MNVRSSAKKLEEIVTASGAPLSIVAASGRINSGRINSDASLIVADSGGRHYSGGRH